MCLAHALPVMRHMCHLLGWSTAVVGRREPGTTAACVASHRRRAHPARGVGRFFEVVAQVPTRSLQARTLRRAPLWSVLIGLAAAAIAAGCGAPQRLSMEHPTDPTAVVLRVDSRGGLLPSSSRAAMLPFFSLYGDGRLLYSASPAVAVMI